MRWEGVVCASQHKAKPSIIMRSNGRPSSILAAASKVLLQYTCCAVILFCVSVPVLSEQMTDTQPKLSTELIFLMMACSFAIWDVPIASTIVTILASASGIAATAKATANIKASKIGFPCHTFKPKTMIQIAMIAILSLRLKSSNVNCNGVFRSFVAFINVAIFPISVCMPMAVTTHLARP